MVAYYPINPPAQFSWARRLDGPVSTTEAHVAQATSTWQMLNSNPNPTLPQGPPTYRRVSSRTHPNHLRPPQSPPRSHPKNDQISASVVDRFRPPKWRPIEPKPPPEQLVNRLGSCFGPRCPQDGSETSFWMLFGRFGMLFG